MSHEDQSNDERRENATTPRTSGGSFGSNPSIKKRDTLRDQGFGPATPFYVSTYHMLVVVIIIVVALCLEKSFIAAVEWHHQVYALLGGGLGGTVTASRWVVLAVRHGEYDPRRLLWQLLTPIYSAALGWVGIIAIRGGLLTLTESPSTKEPNFTYFVIAFSFLVGFASEAFLKRLILAAQTLFGEHKEDIKEIEAGSGPMKLHQVGERSLIRQYVYPELQRHQSEFLGDDAAVVRLDDERALVISTDAGPQNTFLESLQVGSWEDIGHFFAAISLSDIAAMGAEPIGLVAAFLMNPATEECVFKDLVHGVSQACQDAGTKYLGGDTKESDVIRLVTTAIGVAKPHEIISRKGAIPGDSIFISGSLGKTVFSYLEAARKKRLGGSSIIRRPQPRLSFARELAIETLASCCMDMSDGPIAAARELSEINKLAFVLDVSKMGILEHPLSLWYSLVLNAGGDLELMFTSPGVHREKLQNLGALECGYVDEDEKAAGVRLINLPVNIEIAPYEHFRSTQSINECLRSLI